MKSFSYIGLAGCALLTLTASPPIRAQIRVGFETGITGHHIYRGLTLNQGATVTSAPYASYLIGSSTIAGGIWSSLEFSKPDLTKDVGFDETTFPETNAWLQASHLLNAAEFTIGLSRHDVRTTGAAGPPENAADTWEIYAQAQTKRSRLNGGLSVFWDVDAVSGLFIRPEISLRIPLLTHLPIHLHHFELIIGSLVTTVGAGIAVDEKLDPGNPSVAGYYEDDGLTHVDWSLTFPVGVDVWLLKIIANPYVSVQLNVDPQTQIVGLLGGDIDRDRKWTGGFTLVVELPRCRPTRGLCQ